MRACLIVGIPVLALLGPAGAAAAEGVSPGQDLKATIALQGLPCDQVLDSKRNADSDYTVTCKDGNRYHISVDPSGRVVVSRL
jgi:hypothetical protein